MAPRRLGQHFLASAAWRERIARAVLGAAPPVISQVSGAEGAATPGNLWIEIGAGHGEMTSLLARRAGRVIAIELDDKLLPRLRQETADLPNVTVMAGDVLALDLGAITEGQRFRAYGNLPYYITSPIVHRLLEHCDRLEAAFLVVQLEVAVRMTARPGRRDYGYFSAFTQFYSKPEIVLRIPPGAFQPPPKVLSALVALAFPGERARLGTLVGMADEERFVTFLKMCFAQKRKTLRNNLRSVMPEERATAVLRECGISATARAEELGVDQLARIFGAAVDGRDSSGAKAPR